MPCFQLEGENSASLVGPADATTGNCSAPLFFFWCRAQKVVMTAGDGRKDRQPYGTKSSGRTNRQIALALWQHPQKKKGLPHAIFFAQHDRKQSSQSVALCDDEVEQTIDKKRETWAFWRAMKEGAM